MDALRIRPHNRNDGDPPRRGTLYGRVPAGHNVDRERGYTGRVERERSHLVRDTIDLPTPTSKLMDGPSVQDLEFTQVEGVVSWMRERHLSARIVLDHQGHHKALPNDDGVRRQGGLEPKVPLRACGRCSYEQGQDRPAQKKPRSPPGP